MQTRITGHVVRSEWRWVIWMSLTLLLISFLPFLLLAAYQTPEDDWQFMGVLHDHFDGAANLSRIQQGIDGNWLVDLRYSPDPYDSALLQPIYTTLGQFARLTLPSPTVIFHLMRVLAALLMFLTIYQLAASIWVKTRTRRIFFLFASVGSGLGWLAIFLGTSANMLLPDLALPQLYPLYSASANVHYPLATAGVALIVSTVIQVFRPGETEMPSVDNGGIVLFFSGVALAFLYPDALLPLGITYSVSVLIQWSQQSKVTIREMRWGLWLFVPALPIMAYDFLLLFHNPGVAIWFMQRGILPTIPSLLVGLGLPFIIALPGLWRAVRNFEADGDRFMLLWLLAMVICGYLPLPDQHYFWLGLMLPITYFATRAMEDFWLKHLRRRYRNIVYVLGLPLLGLSHIIWLFAPLIPIYTDGSSAGVTLSQDYVLAFGLLNELTGEDDVILASPTVSLWIPTWVGTHVVYGHYAETPNAEEMRNEVKEWYSLPTQNLEECSELLGKYSIRYVIIGEYERNLGDAACAETLEEIAASGDVSIYAVSEP